MSKKHLEEQKLLIENFNKWIQEANDQAEELETLSEEQLNEVLGMALVAKLLGAIFSALSFYDDLTDINTQIQKNESLPGNVKETSQTAVDGLAQLKTKMGPIGKLAEMYGHDLNPLAIKQNVVASLVKQVFGLDFGGTPSEEEPGRSEDPEMQSSKAIKVDIPSKNPRKKEQSWEKRMGIPPRKDKK